MDEHIIKDDVRRRYVATDDSVELGFVSYTDRGDAISLDHTVVHPQFQNQGVAARLVQHALDDLGATTTKRIEPRCSYVVQFLSKHPEYAALTRREPS